MNEMENLKLIEGTFSKEDARDILISIFNSKINFYKLKNISLQERYGEDDEIAQAKIKKLKASIEKIRAIIAEAKKNNKRLIIDSEVSISFSDDE